MSSGEPPAAAGPPQQPPEQRDATMPPGEEVLAVEAVVEEDRGRYVVHLDVLLATGAVRRRGGDFPDRARAEQAARIMARNAHRHLPPAVTNPSDERTT